MLVSCDGIKLHSTVERRGDVAIAPAKVDASRRDSHLSTGCASLLLMVSILASGTMHGVNT